MYVGIRYRYLVLRVRYRYLSTYVFGRSVVRSIGVGYRVCRYLSMYVFGRSDIRVDAIHVDVPDRPYIRMFLTNRCTYRRTLDDRPDLP